MATRKRLSFLLNGMRVDLRTVPPERTLLDFLRLERGLTGTKEGCAEGDCGACTVLVGRLSGTRVDYAPVNACIRLLASLDGFHVVTIEHLGGRAGDHPLQEAMVSCHGSQCGYCTPGIVMALAANRMAGGTDYETALQGNLCRCTGYGPILAAAEEAGSPPPGGDPLQTDPAVIEALGAMDDGADLELWADAGTSYLPGSAARFAELRAAHPEARIVAGATDYALRITKRLELPEALLFTGRVAGFDDITDDGAELRFGPNVSFAQAMPVLDAAMPAFARLWRRIGGPQIRAAGTIAGNIANGSPIGDSPPVLIALGARLVLRRGETRRELPLEAYFLDYGRQDLHPGEFIEAVVVPRPAPGAILAAHKVSKRPDEDISTVLGAFHITLDDGVVSAARIACGGMAGVPKRATTVEAALIGELWSETTVGRAMEGFAADFQPLSDMRGSAGYRLEVARNLLMRVFLESRGQSADLREMAHV